MIKYYLNRRGKSLFGYRDNAGFTLLEALVAVSILMVAVAAPITIAQKGLSSAVYTKNQMIASYLAQDAIEYIKNIRDNTTMADPANPNWGDLWDSGGFLKLCNIANKPDGCQIDTVVGLGVGEVTNFSEENHLMLDGDGFYSYSGSTRDTGFTRQIQVKLNDLAISGSERKDEALVTVTVKWGDSNQVVVKTLIYNY
jgi:type II secretory pathway pseudopilin PulG